MACITAIVTDETQLWGRTCASPRSPDTEVEQGNEGPLTVSPCERMKTTTVQRFPTTEEAARESEEEEAPLCQDALSRPEMERMQTRPVQPAAEPLVERQFLEPEPKQDGHHVQESNTAQWIGIPTLQDLQTLQVTRTTSDETLASHNSEASSFYQYPALSGEIYQALPAPQLDVSAMICYDYDQAAQVAAVAAAAAQPETPEQQPKLGTRYTGRCVKFEGTYGFLGTDIFKMEFFCHKDDLHCPKDAWKSLKVHEEVEFELTWDATKNNYKAVKVTGPDGAYVVGTPKPPMRQRGSTSAAVHRGRSKKNRNSNPANSPSSCSNGNPWCSSLPVVCQGWMHGNCPMKNCNLYHPADQYNIARRRSFGRSSTASSLGVYQPGSTAQQ